MEFKFEGMDISSEEDLYGLVERINSDAEFAKELKKYGIKDERIDLKALIRGYREKIRKLDIKQFRIEHECRNCADYHMKSCRGIPLCRYETDFQREKKVKHEKAICPMDKTGDCPYGRPEGICIGPCYREIVEDFRGGNGRDEPSKEDSGNG